MPLTLLNTPERVLKDKKLRSLAKKYRHIPEAYQHYYPKPEDPVADEAAGEEALEPPRADLRKSHPPRASNARGLGLLRPARGGPAAPSGPA